MTAQETRDKWRYTYRFREWARLTIAAHKRRGLVPHFTQDWLEGQAEKTTHCHLCGAELNFKKKESRCPESNSPSLDRIKRCLEMTQDNVVIICYACNTGKGVGTTEEYIERCKRVAKNNELEMI